MSKQAASEFRAKVADSEDLQKAVQAALASGGDADLVKLAQQHGFEFTAEEGKAALADSALSSFELEMVSAGGGMTTATGGTVSNYDKSGQTVNTKPTNIDPASTRPF